MGIPNFREKSSRDLLSEFMRTSKFFVPGPALGYSQMAPRKRRRVRRVKGSTINPVNTCGFAALPDEIYLEILSHIPSAPIPVSIQLESYPEICRSRRETFRSLSQTSRSLRRFFWRYLWQHIEVREGIQLVNSRGYSHILNNTGTITAYKKFAKELLRQLNIVTVRKPQLAQYVKWVSSSVWIILASTFHLWQSYLDVSICQHSIETVLGELARCLSIFPNLHTVQIDVISSTNFSESMCKRVFEHTFKNHSYPQIRNVFVMRSNVSFVSSCPQARRVGLLEKYRTRFSRSSLETVKDSCPHLEVLEDFGEVSWTPDTCECAYHLYLGVALKSHDHFSFPSRCQ